jgi:hypothetical protein
VQCFVLPISSILVQKHTTRVLFEAQPARAINNADTKLSLPGNLLAGQHDTKKKRTPPSQPIEVRFPLLQPPEPSTSGPPSSWTSDRDSGISAHFLGLKRPSDVTEATLALLNVSFQPECDFETLLLSLSSDAQSHLPPKDWLDPPEHIDLLMSSGSAVTLLSNGRRKPDHNEFYVRVRELLFDNADAFSTLTRKGGRGQTSIRLTHFRKFWEGLDNMAYYWDNSLDEYQLPSPESVNGGGETTSKLSGLNASIRSQGITSETKADWNSKTGSELSSPSYEEPRKKAKVEAVLTSPQSASANVFPPGSAQTSSVKTNRVLPARAAPPKAPWATALEHPNKPIDISRGSYRGYRLGNGAEMPDQYRLDCVRAFLEPIAWAFGVTLAQHRRPPVLKLQRVRFPVRMSSVAWRSPQDRAKARQGWMEGPLLGIQCRADVNFGSTGKTGTESVLDTVRELGGLLLLAQERAREGKTERRDGEGQWWTTKERWGGGPGGEVGDAQGASDGPAKETSGARQEKLVQRNPDGSKVRHRPTPAELWKVLRPGGPLWDPKVTYEAIGRDRSMEWDDVRLYSACRGREYSLTLARSS